MVNLAGVHTCDETIRRELADAGITIIEGICALHEEVPYSVIGILGAEDFMESNKALMRQYRLDMPRIYEQPGSFVFSRQWYYWEVRGCVPLSVAQELYDNEVGRKYVRILGGANNRPPDDWVTRTCLIEEWDARGETRSLRHFTPYYHIDTPEGLALFVSTLKKHNLI